MSRKRQVFLMVLMVAVVAVLTTAVIMTVPGVVQAGALDVVGHPVGSGGLPVGTDSAPIEVINYFTGSLMAVIG